MTTFNARLSPGSGITTLKLRSAPGGGLVQANVTGITLKNTLQTDANRRLDGLLDVIPDTANTVAGSTLVYDPVTDKYVVKLLDLDGGSF